MRELWDVNCMIGRWPTETLLFRDVSGLVQRMDQLGITRAVVAHTQSLHHDPFAGNRELTTVFAQLSPQERARLLPCWTLVPPTTGECAVGAELRAELRDHGVRVVRLYPREHNYALGSVDTAVLLATLEHDRVITLIDAEQTSWEEIDRVAAAFPQLPLVICHVGYRSLRRLSGVLERRPNCHIDLAFFSSHEGLEWLVARHAASRVLFGTGAPVSDGGGAVTRLLTSGLDESARALIGSGNLAKLLAAPRPALPTPLTSGAATPATAILREEPITSCDVIDAHAHVGPWFNFFTPEPTAEAMVQVMNRTGVRMAVLSSTLAIGPDAAAGNAEMIALVQRLPERFAGYAVFNPHHAGSVEDVAAALETPGVVGIKIHPDVHTCSVNDPRYAPLWELAQRRGAPVLTHTFAGSPYCDPTDFDSVARTWPNAAVILGHAGVTGAGHLRSIAVAQQHPNLYLEICGSYTTGFWIKRMVEAVGAERVLYGSDFPFIELRYALGRAVFAGLDEAALALVLGGNARRLLRLPGPA